MTAKVINRDPGNCPIDFVTEYKNVSSLSQYLASTSINGTVDVDAYKKVTLSGSKDVNVFNLNGMVLSSAYEIDLNIPSDAKAIINVSGTTLEIGSSGMYDFVPENVLFNFYEAQNLNIHNIGFNGSILAPNASVTFNSSHANGSLIAGSVTGDVEFHYAPFSSNLSDLPPAIKPLVESVIKNIDGTYTVNFGYDNPGELYSIAAGTADNGVNYNGTNNRNMGQPEFFQPGRVKKAFSVDFDGSMIEWHILGLSISATGADYTGQEVNDANEDYLYRPYPNLFVHGFNFFPLETFNLPTRKRKSTGTKAEKRDYKNFLYYSTFITDDLNKNDNAIPGHLMQLLDPESGFDVPNSRQFKDFYRTPTSSKISETRMSPFEEDSSYILQNHSYVEAHCYNYSYESNDDDGVKYGHFSRPNDIQYYTYDTTIICIPGTSICNVSVTSKPHYDCSDDQYGCYHIKPSTAFPTAIDRYGGQAQHIRIRLIQLLNEYYGDWKWVNDPTAKVNIICHSNGGLLTTYALAYDSLYYNNGYTYAVQDHTENCWTEPQYNITGLGFRLADHINQVITIDTPFDGSPMADKDGKPGKLPKEIFGPLTKLLFDWPPADLADPVTQALTLAFTECLSYIFNDVIDDWFSGLMTDLESNGPNTPIMRDFGPGSDFNKSMHASPPPHYSDGNQIPYYNIVGILDKAGKISNNAGRAFKIRGISRMFQLRFVSGRRDLKKADLFNNVGDWCNNSDFVVPVKSQNMNCIYPDYKNYRVNKMNKTGSKPISGLLDPIHMKIANGLGVDAVIKVVAADSGADYVSGNKGLELKVPYLICKNQPDENSKKIIKKTNTLSCGASLVPDLSHSFIRFEGMCGSPDQRWLTPGSYKNSISKFYPNVTSGKPVKLAVYLHDYFCNNKDLTVVQDKIKDTVPFYDITQNPPSEGIGSWASRFVDQNGDGNIDNDDQPGGTWVFVPIDTTHILQGENIVSLRKQVVGNNGELQHYVNIHWGNSISVFETDNIGNPVNNSFINQNVSWFTGEEKHVFCGFLPLVDGSRSENKLAIRNKDGETDLTRVSGSSISAGQYRFFDTGTKWVLEFALNSDQLSRDSLNNIDPVQMIHLTLVDTAGNLSNANITFYIDKAQPQIAVFEPLLKGDFNGDGFVNNQDSCTTMISVQPLPPCSTICSTLGIVDDPTTIENECTEAETECRNSNPAAQVPVSHTECDGIDNNGNGIMDDADPSEITGIQYYSPKYDFAGICTNPVKVTFQISDDPVPEDDFLSVEWRVYRAVNNTADPNTDYLEYTSENYSRKVVTNNLYVTTSWNFKPYTKNNPPRDGLYYVQVRMIKVNDNGSQEQIVSQPAYFIIDRTPPSMTILKDWHDEHDSLNLTSSSQIFQLEYKPGPRSGIFDAELQDLRIIFHPEGGSFSNLYEFTSAPVYSDNLTYIPGTGFPPSSWQNPDGQIDPTIFELPFGNDFSATNKDQLKNWYLNQGYSDEKAQELVDNYSLEELKDVLMKGNYTVEYILEDNAGNTTTYYDKNKIISIAQGNDIPILENDFIDVDGKNTFDESNDEWHTSTNGDSSALSLTSDAINFSWIKSVGNFSFTIKITGMQVTGSNGIGVMARTSLNADAVFASIFLKDNGNAFVSSRSNPGDIKYVSGPLSGTYSISNTWLRMEREGSTIKEYISTDGTNFTFAGQFTINQDTLYVGAYQSNFSGDSADASFKIVPKLLPSSPNGFGVFSSQQTILLDRSCVKNGAVGSNGYVELGYNTNIIGNTSAGGNFLMRDRSKITGDLKVVGTLTKQNTDTITGTIYHPAVLNPVQIPVYSSIPVSSISKTVKSGDSLVLSPGMYDSIIVSTRSKLILRAGSYSCRFLKIDSDAKVRIESLTGSVDIRVTNEFTFGDRSTFGSIATSPQQVSIYTNQSLPLTIGYGTYLS